MVDPLAMTVGQWMNPGPSEHMALMRLGVHTRLTLVRMFVQSPASDISGAP